MKKKKYPVAVDTVLDITYDDDIMDSFNDSDSAQKVIEKINLGSEKGGYSIKNG